MVRDKNSLYHEIRHRLRETLRGKDDVVVTAALYTLPLYQRRALMLCYGPEGDGLTQEQIGCRLGVTDRTVREYCRVGIETMAAQIWEN